MVSLTKIVLSGTRMGLQVITKEAFWLKSFGIVIPRGIPAKVIGAGQQQGIVRYSVSLVYKLLSRIVWK